jgi:hypothetical protein
MSERERIEFFDSAGAGGSATSSFFAVKVGGTYIWSLEGTFGGGSYQLQTKNANGTATDVSGVTMSAAGFLLVTIAPGSQVRIVETGATSAMYSTLVRVPA